MEKLVSERGSSASSLLHHLHGKPHVGTTYKRALPRKNLGMDQPVPGCLGNPEAFRRTLTYHRHIDNQRR